jgi:hypothetical protein
LGQLATSENELGNAAKSQSDEHYLKAGRYLAEAKKLLHDGGSGVTWPNWLSWHFTVGKGRADELIRMSEGKTTPQEARQSTAARVAKHREAKKSSAVTVTTNAPGGA